MNVILGDKRRFAAEVGEQGQLRRVDLWAAGKWLTCDDNMAYVPQFRRDVLDTAAWLQSGEGFSMPFAGLSAEATLKFPRDFGHSFVMPRGRAGVVAWSRP
ncbi:hypothetical protein ACLQ2L_19640, partial [Streptomyces sp. DT203]